MAGGIGGFGRSGLARPEPQRPMGPDDDEDFLWKLDKQRFEEKRAREREEQRAAEERRAREERRRRAQGGQDPTDGGREPGADGPDADGTNPAGPDPAP